LDASGFAEASVFAKAMTDKTADLKATARLGEGPSRSTADKRYSMVAGGLIMR